jgi:hypothetical protein
VRDLYDCAYNGAGKKEILERKGRRLLKLMRLRLRRSFGNCRH